MLRVLNGDPSHTFHHHLITRVLYCGIHVKSVHVALMGRARWGGGAPAGSSAHVIEMSDLSLSGSARAREGQWCEFDVVTSTESGLNAA